MITVTIHCPYCESDACTMESEELKHAPDEEQEEY
jgi:hypothetical protein